MLFKGMPFFGITVKHSNYGQNKLGSLMHSMSFSVSVIGRCTESKIYKTFYLRNFNSKGWANAALLKYFFSHTASRVKTYENSVKENSKI